MAFCKSCGKELAADASFCTNCGTPAKQQTAQSIPASTPQQSCQTPGRQPVFTPASGQLDTGMLVFSIINIFVCTIFGIIALVMTITAKDASSAEEEAQKLKTAKTLNIVGVVVFASLIVISFLFALVIPTLVAGIVGILLTADLMGGYA